jgi:RNA polymerase sigma-70 factor (ECF subfamily)
MKAFENFSQLRQPEFVRAWMFTIARNACMHMRRKSVFAPEREISLDELKPAWRGDGDASRLDIADWSALPEDRALQAELNGKLREAIQLVPDLYRSVLLLRDVEEMSTAETAQILGISADVVKTRLHRARLAVRAHLDSYLKSARSLVP